MAVGGQGAVIDKSPYLTMLAAALSIVFTLSGPLSLVFGVIASIKDKEWSVWLPLIMLYGITLLLFLLGEFLYPH